MIIVGCNKPLKNQSDNYSSCNQLINVCQDGQGAYCLNGYKWGENNPLNEKGLDAVGPQSGIKNITYSFQEKHGKVNSHVQIDLPGLSWNTLPDCARKEIRKAFQSWSEVADLEFEELPQNNAADIRISVADIHVGGLGFPNFPESPCDQIAGNIIILANSSANSECHDFYIFALHEIGHVLGLGHVTSENIMNPEKEKYDYSGLQTGDIQGIIALYGRRI